MMKILISGIAGFIGTSIREALLKADYEVCGFDLNTAGLPKRGIYECDVRDASRVEEIFEKEKPSVCVHLAAIAHADVSPEDEDRVRAINVAAPENVARVAAETGTKRFLFFSSAKVFGERTGPEGIDEAQEPQPEGIYGRLKLEAEQRLQRIAGDTGLELCIVRPVAIFGPGDSRGNYSKLIRAVRHGFFPVIDGGRARRSVSFLPRVAEKVVRIVTAPNCESQPMVFSDGDFSLMEIMKAIRRATGFALFPPVPGRLARTVATVIDAGWRVAGKKTGPAGRVLDRLTENFVVRAQRYEKRFGALPPLDLDRAIKEAASDSQVSSQ